MDRVSCKHQCVHFTGRIIKTFASFFWVAMGEGNVTARSTKLNQRINRNVPVFLTIYLVYTFDANIQVFLEKREMTSDWPRMQISKYVYRNKPDKRDCALRARNMYIH